MKTRIFLLLAIVSLSSFAKSRDKFPDGTDIPEWFRQTSPIELSSLGKQYVITDYGVKNDSTILQTEAIQKVIDDASSSGGGVVVIPNGTYMTGALFFKPGTHLHIQSGGVLKGSDDISDYPIVETRMEGQTLKYFPAIINADHVDGFTMTGSGSVDGNGLRYWKHFWLRRGFNPQCTNMDEMRPRLLYVSNSDNVRIEGLYLHDSPFWSTHFYRCNHLKILNMRITSPSKPVKAPSTDAIDLDVCSNVLVKGCYFAVNDDGVVLKGGKGPYADTDPNNGENTNIIIEDCEYGFCHGALTCGSESIHDRNIILRNCKINGVQRLLWLKMRPDTPQNYEYITVENITGNANYFLYIMPWTQFFDLKGRTDIPMSYSSHVTLKNIKFSCQTFFQVQNSPDQYKLDNFTFENLDIEATKKADCDKDIITNSVWKNVKVNGKKL